jgi:putative drug exporter of the RND superfamily
MSGAPGRGEARHAGPGKRERGTGSAWPAPQRRSRRRPRASGAHTMKEPDAAWRAAGLLHRCRWLVLALWVVTIALGGLSARSLPGRLSGGGWYVPGSGSQVAASRISHGFAGRGASDVTLVVTGPAAQARPALEQAARDPRLQVSSAGPAASSGSTYTLPLGLRMNDGAARRELPGIQASLSAASQGVRVALVSAGAFFGEVNSLSQRDLVLAELATLPLIGLILLLLYRSVAAAAVSFVAGGTAIAWTFGILSLLARQHQISIFAENASSMIGLGVSIDYSLFMISRYRAERQRAGGGNVPALATALRTSGHTVLFSGVIVMAAMSALFLINLNVIQSIALGVVIVTGLAVLASLVVLPAVLLAIGDRIEWGRIGRRGRAAGGGQRWERFAHAVMRRPLAVLLVTGAALGALAVPALSLRTFTPDVSILPPSSASRWGYEAIAGAFGPGAPSPMLVVVPAAQRLPVAASISRLPGVAGVQTASGPYFVSADGRTGIVAVLANGSASASGTLSLLSKVRAAAAAHGGVVGGESAEGADANAAIAARLPLVAVVMLAVIYALLLVTFRSVLLPLKAIAVNCLSVAATYGILVLLFARGGGYLQNFVPSLLLAVLFSLSTDYEVFLLSRVREEYLASGDNSAAVASGLAQTAPLISGAAALMIAVFGGFGFIGLMPMRQLGVGLAVAVALDATVIRLLVVPAFMRLAGRWNWWFPGLAPFPVTSMVKAGAR